jgi:hypothetical protein
MREEVNKVERVVSAREKRGDFTSVEKRPLLAAHQQEDVLTVLLASSREDTLDNSGRDELEALYRDGVPLRFALNHREEVLRLLKGLSARPTGEPSLWREREKRQREQGGPMMACETHSHFNGLGIYSMSERKKKPCHLFPPNKVMQNSMLANAPL